MIGFVNIFFSSSTEVLGIFGLYIKKATLIFVLKIFPFIFRIYLEGCITYFSNRTFTIMYYFLNNHFFTFDEPGLALFFVFRALTIGRSISFSILGVKIVFKYNTIGHLKISLHIKI